MAARGVKVLKVHFTPEGVASLLRYQERLVKAEFRAALQLIGDNPRAGKVVKTLENRQLHRVVLWRSKFLLYYFLQDNKPWIINIWPGQAGARPLEE